jgi:hypothetical protein
MIILIVKPSRNDGLKTYSTCGQLSDGYVGGRLVVSRSRSRRSMLAGFLLARGLIPQRVVMRHAGQHHDALGSTVGAAANDRVWPGQSLLSGALGGIIRHYRYSPTQLFEEIRRPPDPEVRRVAARGLMMDVDHPSG